MRGRERLFQCFLIFFGNLHLAKRHVHVVLCDEDDAALGGELCLEAVAVVEITVVFDGDVLVGGDALVAFRLGIGRAPHRVQDVPARRPKLAAQDEFVEIVRVLGKLDREIDMLKCRFVFFRRVLDLAQALQGEDLFLDVLAVFLVDFFIENGVKKLACFLIPADLLHGKEMAEARACMPVVEATGKKRLRRSSLACKHESDERLKIFMCHG